MGSTFVSASEVNDNYTTVHEETQYYRWRELKSYKDTHSIRWKKTQMLVPVLKNRGLLRGCPNTKNRLRQDTKKCDKKSSVKKLTTELLWRKKYVKSVSKNIEKISHYVR